MPNGKDRNLSCGGLHVYMGVKIKLWIKKDWHEALALGSLHLPLKSPCWWQNYLVINHIKEKYSRMLMGLLCVKPPCKKHRPYTEPCFDVCRAFVYYFKKGEVQTPTFSSKCDIMARFPNLVWGEEACGKSVSLSKWKHVHLADVVLFQISPSTVILFNTQTNRWLPPQCVSYIPLPTKESRPSKLSQSKRRLLQITELSVSVYFVFLHLIIVADSCIH